MKERLETTSPPWSWWRRVARGLLVAGMLVGGLSLAQRYAAHKQTVPLDINGVRVLHSTHKSSASEVLAEMNIRLGENDLARLPSDEELAEGAPITLDIARRIWLSHDGALTELHTHSVQVDEVLREAGVTLSEHDGVWLDGQRLSPEDPLPEPVRPSRAGALEWVATLREPLQLNVRRGVPVTVQEDGIPLSFYTSARTVGEALYAQGISLFVGDRIFPEPDVLLSPGMTISISRAQPVTLEVDGSTRMMRTRASTVEELLSEAGITLEQDDYTVPEAHMPLSTDLHIRVVRVYDEYYVEETPIPFETRWQANPELEIDQRRTASWGREGALRQQVRVHYENGQEVHRVEEEAWVAREPEDRILEYGTKIVVRQLETEHGTIEYWRKLRMLATSYNAATAGKPASSPTYGITRLGEVTRKGIVAVDPTIIPLRQPLYVPGYGLGYGGDTGSGVKDRRIDLCYDDYNLVSWHHWVDVYLLTPVPPASQITWIIPNNPRERE